MKCIICQSKLTHHITYDYHQCHKNTDEHNFVIYSPFESDKYIHYSFATSDFAFTWSEENKILNIDNHFTRYSIPNFDMENITSFEQLEKYLLLV